MSKGVCHYCADQNKQREPHRWMDLISEQGGCAMYCCGLCYTLWLEDDYGCEFGFAWRQVEESKISG